MPKFLSSAMQHRFIAATYLADARSPAMMAAFGSTDQDARDRAKRLSDALMAVSSANQRFCRIPADVIDELHDAAVAVAPRAFLYAHDYRRTMVSIDDALAFLGRPRDRCLPEFSNRTDILDTAAYRTRSDEIDAYADSRRAADIAEFEASQRAAA